MRLKKCVQQSARLAVLILIAGLLSIALVARVRAADIQLAWSGCTPLCGVYQNGLLIGVTDKKSAAIRGVDGRACIQWRVCAVESLPPHGVLTDNGKSLCAELKIRGASKLVECK